MLARWKALRLSLILSAIIAIAALALPHRPALARLEATPGFAPPPPAPAAPQGTIGFAPAVTYTTADSGVVIATGDFNRDGILDLVNASILTQHKANVLLGNADGSFGPAVQYETGLNAVFGAVGDLNRDGKDDLAVVHYNEASVSVLIGNGSGGFGPPTAFATVSEPIRLHIRDIDTDGNMDLIVSGIASSNNIGAMLGNGSGSFAAPIISTIGRGNSAVLDDFNHDGRLDIAETDENANTYVVAFGDGAGAFASPSTYSLAAYPLGMITGDWNRDGNPDLAVVLTAPDNYKVAVALGSASGSFGAPTAYPVSQNPNLLAAADLDSDGSLDLALTSQTNSSVSILRGSPSGSFSPAGVFSTVGGALGVTVGDFNRDGRADLATSNDPSGVAVLINTTPTACATGLTLGPAPIFAGNLHGSVVADLNTDGHLDLVAVSQGTTSVVYRYGDGTGGFSGGGSVAVGAQPNDLAAGDFNNDSHIDLVATLGGANLASVLGNDGAGGFTTGNVATYAGPTGVAVLDANRDALLDFATTSTGNAMRIHFNIGGSFGAIGYGPAGGYADIAVEDLNRDGAPDVALVNSTLNRVELRFNTGTGSYYSAITTLVGTSPSAVAVGDWDRDGILDLAVTNRTSDTVSLLRGHGTTFSSPPFTATGTLSTGDQPNAVISQDIDNDGRLDLVVAYQAVASVTVFRGNGDGSFAAGQGSGPAIASRGLSAGDFNQDGRVDLAVPDLLGDTVRILLSDCPVAPTTPALTYLPLLPNTKPVLLATVNPQSIPIQPVTTPGATFYTTTIQLAGPLPVGGRFYFSSSLQQVQPVQVDDELVVSVNGQERLVRYTTYPVVVEVPRAEIEQWVGQNIVVTFRDKYGSAVGSAPVWLVWVP